MNETARNGEPSASYGYDLAGNIKRYRSATARPGKHFMLRSTYLPAFLDSLSSAVRDSKAEAARTLEFGCGGGMATFYLADELRRRGVPVELMVGADLVPNMIAAARKDLADNGGEWTMERLRFVVAPHERLIDDLPVGLGLGLEELEGSFHLAFGVSTFRYAVQEGTAAHVVAQFHRLLAPGGRVVMFDMNSRFPYGKHAPQEKHASFSGVPTLDQYARPFSDAGFEIMRRDMLGWVPHSAKGLEFWAARAASPVLGLVAPSRAMRSLVIARKPV